MLNILKCNFQQKRLKCQREVSPPHLSPGYSALEESFLILISKFVLVFIIVCHVSVEVKPRPCCGSGRKRRFNK